MDKFYLPDEAVDQFREAVDKGAKAQEDWQKRFEAYKKDYPERSR